MNETVPTGSGSTGELGKRIASGIVMAVLATGAVVLGGWPFALFWAAAALGVFWEWNTIVSGGAVAERIVGAAALIVAALAAGAGQLYAALIALAAGAAGVAGIGSNVPSDRAAASPLVGEGSGGRSGDRGNAVPPRTTPTPNPSPQGGGEEFAALSEQKATPVGAARAWGAAGVVYAGAVLFAPVALRRDREFGLVAMLFLFAVVWATDILGYFIGRAIGGARLAPQISPKKTWSGALGGTLGALLAGVAVIHAAGDAAIMPAACVALVLSVVSQAGDLFESAVKRRFGVKDASHVIPGHGGLMDRLDGFIAAAGVAAMIGLMRGGPDASARGLLLW